MDLIAFLYYEKQQKKQEGAVNELKATHVF